MLAQIQVAAVQSLETLDDYCVSLPFSNKQSLIVR